MHLRGPVTFGGQVRGLRERFDLFLVLGLLDFSMFFISKGPRLKYIIWHPAAIIAFVVCFVWFEVL
jgi:hypothetical protein